MPELPKYSGKLAPTGWSVFRVTPEIRENLRQAALHMCSGCRGAGWTGTVEQASICPCTLRPPSKNEIAGS